VVDTVSDATSTTARCASALRSPVDEATADHAASVFKALADPTRVRLLRLVMHAGAGEACVCDLTDAVGLSQPTVSHHLAVLVAAGFLQRERRGTWAWYRAVPETLDRTGLRAALDALA
jgi:ArsR family transcriptional regulator